MSTTVGLGETTGGCIGIWVVRIGAGGCDGEAFLPGQDGSTIVGNGFAEASRRTSLATIGLGAVTETSMLLAFPGVSFADIIAFRRSRSRSKDLVKNVNWS